MNVSSAITGYLNNLRNSTLSNFDYIHTTFIYDESLDFRGRASQFISKQDDFQQKEGNDPNDWAFIIWNRGNLQTNANIGRPLNISIPDENDPDKIVGVAKIRMAHLDIDAKIVTNNINVAETIEEFLHVLAGEHIIFDADYGSIYGSISCSAQADSTTSFEKDDINSVGSVIAVGLTATINFPVILPTSSAKRIEHIHEKIYSGFTPTEILVNDEWILTEP